MKILVFIKAVQDVKIPVELTGATGRVREDLGVTILNPADRSALETALALKEQSPETTITAIHLGPPPGERFVREALALGCDEGVRIWEEDGLLGKLLPSAKARIFARIAEVLGFDLLFTGAMSQDTGNGQVGALLASYLGVPSLPAVTALTVNAKERTLSASRRLAQGYQGRLQSTMPVVIGVEELGERGLPEPSLFALIEAHEKGIPCFQLADLGIPGRSIDRMNSCLASGPLRFPGSKLRPIPAPDPTLPSFLRIKALVEGTVKRREGRLVAGSEDQIIKELFEVLLKEGWLRHLKNSPAAKP